jgi:NADH:ubiquinone oxidoreductase subunit 6 (subunit J)
MKNLLTQVNLYPAGGLRGVGNGPLSNPQIGAVGIFSNFISGTIGVLTIVAIVWAVITLITGAISVISSGGDKGQVENAKKKITTGLVGLVIVIVALLIIELVGHFLGLTDILNIQSLFNLISPPSP